jgi:hypothetical protein
MTRVVRHPTEIIIFIKIFFYDVQSNGSVLNYTGDKL